MSSAIAQRHKLVPGSVQRATSKFSETLGRSASTLLQPVSEAALGINTGAGAESGTTPGGSLPVAERPAHGEADRPGELRTGTQDSAIATAQPGDYQAREVSRSDVVLTSPLEVTKERTISRTALSKASGADPALDRAALTTMRDFTISPITGKSATQRSGAGGETSRRPGGVTMGVILRAPGTRSSTWPGRPVSLVTRQQQGQITGIRYPSYTALSLSARGPLPTLLRYGHAPALDRTFRGAETGAGSRASSAMVEDSLDRRTINTEQPRTDWMDAPGNKVPPDAPETALAPAMGPALTNPASSQITATVTRSLSSGASDKSVLAAQSSDHQVIKSGGGNAVAVFTARRMAIGFRPADMALSTAPILRRDNSLAGAVNRSIFPERSVAFARTVLRVANQRTLGFDNPIRGNESDARISVFPGGGAGVVRMHRALDNTLVSGPLSRADVESGYRSADSAMASGVTSLAQPRDGNLSGTDDAWRAKLGISRVAVARVESEATGDAGDLAHRQVRLPMYQATLFLGGFGRTLSSAQRVVGRLSAPLSLAGSALTRSAVSDQLPAITIPSRAIQSTETLPAEWIRDVTAGESSEFHLPPAGPTPALAPMRHGTIAAPTLLRRSDAPADIEHHAATPATRATLHEMPFAALSIIRGGRSLAAVHRANGSSL
ncbi:MAG: hypothetical protein ACREQV_13155, partial [Candidatus Binatia bacterium]